MRHDTLVLYRILRYALGMEVDMKRFMIKILGFHGKAYTRARRIYTHYNTHPFEVTDEKDNEK